MWPWIFLGVCLAFAFGVGVWSLWFTSPKQIGIRGESKVNKILHDLNGEVYEDYIIVDDNHKSHQIDSILVNSKGVFIIETKNYSGAIYGDDNSTKFTQVLKYGKVKNHFYSPLKQNAGHCYYISNILPKGIKAISIVVFVRNNVNHIKSDSVVALKQLKKKILSYKDIYDDHQLHEINEALLKNRNIEITNKEHVKNIKNTKKEINHNICPRCGGKLVLRHGKNGDFYGCENFPKCRFVKNCK